MEKKITKVTMPVSVDRNLSELIKENITNRSKYIEWLIFQDFKKNNVEGIDKLLLLYGNNIKYRKIYRKI